MKFVVKSAFALFFFIGVYVFIWALSGPYQYNVAGMLATSYCTLRLVYLVFFGRNYYILVMMHFFLLFGNLVPINIQYTYDSFTYEFVKIGQFDFTTPLLITLVGIMCVDIAHTLTARFVGLSKNPPSATTALRPHAASAAAAQIILMCLVSILIGLVAISSVGVSFYQSSRLIQYLDFTMSSSQIFFGSFFVRHILFFAVAISLALLLARTGQKRPIKSFAIAMLILTTMLALFANPLSAPRMVIFAFPLLIFMVVVGMEKVRYRTVFLFSSIIGLYFVFPFVGAASRFGVQESPFSIDVLVRYMRHLDLDNGIQSILGYAYVQENGILWGNNILSAVFAFVPRSVWPDKTEGFGAAIVENFGITFTNVSAPLFTEFYGDFGVAGVVVFSSLTGAVFAYVTYRADRSEPMSFWHMVALSFFVSMPILLRGAMIAAFIAMYSLFASALILTATRWLAIRLFASKPKGGEVRHENT